MEPESNYGKRLHKAARQEFRKFWSAHRLRAILSTLAVTVSVIGIQVAYRGVGSVEQTIVSGVVGLGVSLIGNYLIAMRRGAESLDSGLRDEIHEKNSALQNQTKENRKRQARLVVRPISLIERNRRTEVEQKMNALPSEFVDVVEGVIEYLLIHGEVDPILLAEGGRLGKTANQHVIMAAIDKAAMAGLLKPVPGTNRHRMMVNPELRDALSFHLLGE